MQPRLSWQTIPKRLVTGLFPWILVTAIVAVVIAAVFSYVFGGKRG
jgi:hypothetical protein